MIVNPNRRNNPYNNVPCSEFWIEESALFYERWTRKGYTYYKYKIVDNELKKFSRAKFAVLDIFFIIVAPYLAIPFIILENCIVKSKMKKVWKEKRNFITVI